MPKYNVRGVDVEFPYDAYPSQIVYMDRVISCLQQGENALLESPTGTGKTLCLLCATLAWREAVSGPRPLIVYASRTHSQLSQVVSELKKTAYMVKTAILGSRDQMCRHPDVMALGGNMRKTMACRTKIMKKSCQFHSNVSIAMKTPLIQEGSIMDIEDLVRFADTVDACPYYVAREQLELADVVFLPYNYLIDPQTRKTQNIPLESSILILDEAHNLESSCSDAYSLDLHQRELDTLVRHLGKDNCSELLQRFLTKVGTSLSRMGKTPGETDGSYLYTLLAQCGVDKDNYAAHIEAIDEMVRQNLMLRIPHADSALSTFSMIFLIFFEYQAPDSVDAFKIWMEQDNSGWKLNLWCFDPSLALKELKSGGCGSIILTSGTLSPLNFLEKELKIPFGIKLENKHVIDSDQIVVAISKYGPQQRLLDSSYTSRSIEYRQELGLAVLSISRVIPSGMLVFFPSYSLLDMCVQQWRVETIYRRLEEQKAIFVEPRDKAEFPSTMARYIASSRTKGSLMLAVCRGKISEGIDFSDFRARGVVIIGIPYPAYKDPKVEQKKRFLDGKAGPGTMSGVEWYMNQAVSSVNQAIGRIIRHKHDYGAVVLLDHRYFRPGWNRSLPKWCKDSVHPAQNFNALLSRISRFFADRMDPIDPGSRAITPEEFLSQVRTKLGKDDYGTFQEILLQFHKGESTIKQMVEDVHSLFSSVDKKLYHDFGRFVPNNHQSIYQEKFDAT